MPIVPIPIGSGTFAAADPTELANPQNAAAMKNIFIDKLGSNTDRPGLATSAFASVGAFPAIGLTFFKNYLVAVTDTRRIYAIASNGTVSEITGASTLGGTSRPVFASDGTYLAIAGGGTPQRWVGDIFVQAEQMPGSPEDCTHIVYLDGYWIIFLPDDQELRIAGPTAPTREVWNTSDFFQAEGLPDVITAIQVNQRELYAIGTKSLEIFQNLGDTSTPFQRTFFIDRENGQSQSTTGSSNYSVLKADNTLFFFDQISRDFIGLQGRTPVIISGPFERDIKAFSTVSDCFGFRVDIDGFYVLVWTFPTEGRTFGYDYQAKQWFELTSYVNFADTRFRANAYIYADSWNKHFVADFQTGNIYEFSRSFKSDADAVMRRIRRTGHYSHGTGARKRSNYYRFDVKRGVGSVDGPEPVFQVRVNDDNNGWTAPVEYGLGLPGTAQVPVEVRLRGIYRKRQLEVSMTDNAEFVLIGIEENVDLLSR